MADKDKEKYGLREISAMSKVDKELTNAKCQPEKNTQTEILVFKNWHKIRKGIL